MATFCRTKFFYKASQDGRIRKLHGRLTLNYWEVREQGKSWRKSGAYNL